MKIIKVKILSNPEKLGYNDLVRVYENDNMIFGCSGSAFPNPFHPTNNKTYKELNYGIVASGVYKWSVYQSPKFGKVLLLNNGKNVTCRNRDNPMTYCEIHSGGFKSKNPDWRGSVGCLTISPVIWEYFINLFGEAETGYLEVEN